MNNHIGVFEGLIYKVRSIEIVDRLHCLAFDVLQASHIFDHYLEENSQYDFPVEIGAVNQLRDIHYIINPDFWSDFLESMEDEMNSTVGNNQSYDGNFPLQAAKNMLEEETISFQCPKCDTLLRVPKQMVFPFVKCKTCGEDIYRNTIKNAGGIYYVDKGSGE